MTYRINGVAAFAAACLIMLQPWIYAHALAAAPIVPKPDHVVVAVMENHSFSQIINSSEAPFIQDLATHGAVFTNSFAVAHPSQPNYFALFSGSTYDISDDGYHALDAPTLAGALKHAGRTFVGYVERGSPRKHNPWESFREAQDVERIDAFPRDFDALPTVSFVIPNQRNDMHDGSIAEGDRWLKDHLGGYAEWCAGHNSLLIVTFDEAANEAEDPVLTIFVGAGVIPGRYGQRIDHYVVLRTIEAMYKLTPLARSAADEPITSLWSTTAINGAERVEDQ